jgi:hypothetical protein
MLQGIYKFQNSKKGISVRCNFLFGRYPEEKSGSGCTFILHKALFTGRYPLPSLTQKQNIAFKTRAANLPAALVLNEYKLF